MRDSLVQKVAAGFLRDRGSLLSVVMAIYSSDTFNTLVYIKVKYVAE